VGGWLAATNAAQPIRKIHEEGRLRFQKRMVRKLFSNSLMVKKNARKTSKFSKRGLKV